MGKKALSLSAFSSPLSDLASAGSTTGRKEGKSMNPLIQLKKASVIVLVAFVLACFGLLPEMQSALPPEIPGNPDGCYPAFTTAEGCNALFLVDPANGIGNTAVGWYSLF